MNITQQLQQTRQRISQACQAAERAESAVKLLAVSKTKPTEAILQAYQAGQTAFGENYVQEGVEKIRWFEERNIALEWHFIGPLQSNKTRLVAEHFDWCQTLDRAKIADRLNDQRPPHKAPLNVLIQINISGEASKSGIAPQDMPALAKHLENRPHLRLRGLMAIPAPHADADAQQQVFGQMQALFRQLQQLCPDADIDTLSMGMSDDLDAAILHGTTMVRVGTAIFGARDYAKTNAPQPQNQTQSQT